jgi:hypothetical protein
MAIYFSEDDGRIILEYISDGRPITWVGERLEGGEYALSRTFLLSKKRLLPPTEEDDEYERRRFVIGRVKDNYQSIDKDVLDLKNDLRISNSISLSKKLFVATGDISIFSRIDKLVDEPIIVGGDHESAIPEEEFIHLLKNFPTRTELKKYADARVARDLVDYFETMSDAEGQLVKYMNRTKHSRLDIKKRDVPIRAANELELEKYLFLRDKLAEMLTDSSSYVEKSWQDIVAKLFLLIFPQYIAVLEKVSLKEYYTNSPKPTTRKFDLVLIDANGGVDLIEIKRPTDNKVLSKRLYRDNYVPHGELSGAIMQAEKYLFYLSKAGRGIEENIEVKYAKQLPSGIEIKVANPKAIILIGRDNTLSARQKLDLGFIRKKYSNMIDILTYDDLLRRIDNIIEVLKTRF